MWGLSRAIILTHPHVPGQRRYQRLLAAFYSNGALYILAFDVSAPAPPIDELRQWICSIQAVAPGSVVLLVGTQCDRAASPVAAERTCRLVLGKLNEALEHQQESMRAQLAQLEAQLPTDESGRHDWSWRHGRDYLPESPLGRQVRKLRQLLETPLRLSPEPVTCSAKTQLNIEDLRGRIKDELFDPSGFPEFGREQPQSYDSIQRQLEKLVQPSMDWSALQSAVSSVPAPSADAELAVRVAGTPALMEAEGKKQYRLYELSLVLSDEPVHRFSVRFSEAQEQNAQLLKAGVISKEQAATFPASSSDHLRDFVQNEANVQKRASELQAYYAAILTQPAVLQHPQLREIIGFDFDLLKERYMAPFELARRDPSLLRRAVAFFVASGDVLHYSGIEALRDRVFLRPLWVSDLMAALVRHDLDERLAMLGDEGTMLPAGTTAAQAMKWAGLYTSRGILDERLLPILWADVQPDVTAEAGLISELVQLLVHMGICSPWTPSADGDAQWLVPLRLPAERAELPQEWVQVAGDADDSSATASFVGRLLDFGAARIPSGCTGQVLAHCTLMAGLSGQTVNWNTGLHALLRSTGHSSFPFMLTIEQSGPQTIALRARVASSTDAHAVLLQSVAMFEVRRFSALLFSTRVCYQLVSFSPCVLCVIMLVCLVTSGADAVCDHKQVARLLSSRLHAATGTNVAATCPRASAVCCDAQSQLGRDRARD